MVRTAIRWSSKGPTGTRESAQHRPRHSPRRQYSLMIILANSPLEPVTLSGPRETHPPIPRAWRAESQGLPRRPAGSRKMLGHVAGRHGARTSRSVFFSALGCHHPSPTASAHHTHTHTTNCAPYTILHSAASLS